MKKILKSSLSLVILAVFIAGGFIYHDMRSSRGLSMSLPSDLGRAVDIMNRVQSNSLNGDIVGEGISDSDIAHMQSVYDSKDAYVEVVDRDTQMKKTAFGSRLQGLYGSGVDLDAVFLLLGSSDAFINKYEDYEDQVGILLAGKIGVPAGDLVNESGLMEEAFYVTSGAWTKRMYWRFGTWFENFKGNQCRSNDYGNDPDVYGYVMMENTAQGEEAEQLADTCSADGTKVIQHVCSNRQYDGTNEMVCEYGCQEGVCLDEPVIVIPDPVFDEFILSTDDTPVAGESFNLVVTAKRTNGSIDTSYDGSIYFQVLGIDLKESDFSRATDLTLVDGEGSFEFNLIPGEDKSINDVTIIVTDVDAGVSERVELGEVVIQSGSIACNLNYLNGDSEFQVATILNGAIDESGIFFNPDYIDDQVEMDFEIDNSNWKIYMYPSIHHTDSSILIGQCDRIEVTIDEDIASCYDMQISECEDGRWMEVICISDTQGTVKVGGSCNQSASVDTSLLLSSSLYIYGCTDSSAFNYNASATHDDGSCMYEGTDIGGCTDTTALNYDSSAMIDDGSCIYPIYGCMDSSASNYDPDATEDDGSCQTDDSCTNGATNFDACDECPNGEKMSDYGICQKPFFRRLFESISIGIVDSHETGTQGGSSGPGITGGINF